VGAVQGRTGKWGIAWKLRGSYVCFPRRSVAVTWVRYTCTVEERVVQLVAYGGSHERDRQKYRVGGGVSPKR